MSDYIGRIVVPDVAASGTFPLKPDYGYGYAEAPQVAIHSFISGNAKIDQRFRLGTGLKTYTFHKAKLREADRVALRDFWEARKGIYQPFTYNAPDATGGGTTAVTVRFADPQLAMQFFSRRRSTVTLTFVQHVAAADAPTYTITETQEYFPSSSLQTALLDQDQQMIPLLRIQVKESAVNPIYLSDRRVVVGGNTYLPRLLDWSGISQTMTGEADQAPFTMGNADGVFDALVADTQLQKAEVQFSLFHVTNGTTAGIKLDRWKGEVSGFSKASPLAFSITATDGIYELRLPYPTRKISRTCWKPLGLASACPYAGSSTLCDKGFTTENGCAFHGMQDYFGGQPMDPQGVRIKDNGQGFMGFGRPTITATSIVNESAFSRVVPEVYTDSEMPVKAILMAGRDESDFYDALCVVSEGPIQGYARDGYACPKHLLDGQVNHGMEDETKHSRHDPSRAQSWYGLWENLGTDPATLPSQPYAGSKSFGLHALDDNPAGRAAGTAFVEIRRTDTPGIQLSSITDHQADIYVSGGMSGWVWTALGTRSTQLLTNPIWIAVNAVLRARGLRFASAATCEQFVDIPAAIAAAAICDISVPVLVGGKEISGARIQPAGDYNLKTDAEWFTTSDVGKDVVVHGAGAGGADLHTTIAYFIGPTCVGLAAPCATAVTGATAVVGSGNEKQYRFRGTLDSEKPLKDWLTEILNNCCGYYTMAFGRVCFGIRSDAVAVEDFNPGNIVLGTLRYAAATPTFNYITVNFADEEYAYQGNAVSVYDIDHALEISGATGPQFLKSDMNLCGAFTKSQAGRVGSVRIREEVGGTTAAERRVCWTVGFRTTALALNVRCGKVCSLTTPEIPGGYCKFRVTKLTLNKDMSIDVEGRVVTASMYDLVGHVGPLPADVASVSVPGELTFSYPTDSAAPSEAPSFGVGKGRTGGSLEFSGFAFADTATNTASVSSGVITMYYADELHPPAAGAKLSGAITATANYLIGTGELVPGWAGYTSGMSELIMIDGEILQATNPGLSLNGANLLRGQKGSTAAAHAAGAKIWLLKKKTVQVSFPPEFFGGAGGWYDYAPVVNMPSIRLCAADLYVTNSVGNSPVKTIWLGSQVEGGLRSGSGSQIELIVEGVLGIEANAVAVTVPNSVSLSQIFAVVDQAATGAGLACVVKVDGVAIGTLTAAAGFPTLAGIDWSALDGVVIAGGAQLSVDVTAVGTTFPGKRLRVIVRL